MNLASHHEMLLIPYVEDTLSPNNKSLVLVSNILAKTKYYITAKKTCLRFQNNNNNNNSYEILLPLFFSFSFLENSIARGWIWIIDVFVRNTLGDANQAIRLLAILLPNFRWVLAQMIPPPLTIVSREWDHRFKNSLSSCVIYQQKEVTIIRSTNFTFHKLSWCYS